MAKVKKHCLRARKSPNLPKVGVAKHKVDVANLKVGGTAAPPTVHIGKSARGRQIKICLNINSDIII